MIAARLRHRTALWIALGAVGTLLLRAPWVDAALGRDEAGVAMIARAWHGGGPFAYGDYFLDRPPLLVALYRVAGDSAIGLRMLGAVAAVLLVVTATLLAVRIGGRRAAPWAAGISAVLASSYEIGSVFTPAELLAVLPSCASVLVLVIALERSPPRLWLYAAAGALAATALLVKQSFGDALAAGLVALVAGKLLGLSWRETARRAGAYGAGVAALLVALVAWVALSGTPAGSVWYAMFGFRIDAIPVLLKQGLETRLSTLQSPLLDSGLALAAVFAVIGIARMRDRPLVRVTVAAWMVTAGAGVLLGGSYWPHYLIALAPGVAAGAAVAFERFRLIGAVAMIAIALPAAIHAINAATSDSPDSFQRRAVITGRYIQARSLPGDTAYVMYAKVNVLYYARLRVPYPYNWSLMVRAVPGAENRLRELLASPQRPTWVVRAHGPRAFGLDRSGATRRLLARHYRSVGTVCGLRLLLARGARVLPAPPAAGCASTG